MFFFSIDTFRDEISGDAFVDEEENYETKVGNDKDEFQGKTSDFFLKKLLHS